MNEHLTSPLLTIQETAQLLRVQRAKVYLLIESTAISAFKVGNTWRVRKDSVEALIGAIPATSFETKLPQEQINLPDKTLLEVTGST
jgi:excisionase family DNA binding protein